MEQTTTRLLTTQQVADKLSVTAWKVHSLVVEDGLPVIRLGHKTLRYDESAIDAWLLQQEDRLTAAAEAERKLTNAKRKRRKAKGIVPFRKKVDRV